MHDEERDRKDQKISQQIGTIDKNKHDPLCFTIQTIKTAENRRGRRIVWSVRWTYKNKKCPWYHRGQSIENEHYIERAPNAVQNPSNMEKKDDD
jgi:hypothetical protein